MIEKRKLLVFWVFYMYLCLAKCSSKALALVDGTAVCSVVKSSVGDIRPRQQYPCQSVAFSSHKLVNI